MTAFYFDKIENFLVTKTDEVVGILSEKQTRTIDLNPKQNDSWRLQIDLFKENFKKIENIKESSILIEYPLLRLSKRLDTIIIVKNLIFLIEFKKSNEFLSSDKKQVEDYATNLKYFHKDSDGRLIIPILFASNAEKRENTQHPTLILILICKKLCTCMPGAYCARHLEHLEGEGWPRRLQRP